MLQILFDTVFRGLKKFWNRVTTLIWTSEKIFLEYLSLVRYGKQERNFNALAFLPSDQIGLITNLGIDISNAWVQKSNGKLNAYLGRS